MENPTRFDLNAAIQGWREALAAKSNVTPEVRRELEAHLHDSIAGLRQRGLNDEECFWLACHRVGNPQQLDEEFAKENPGKLWRERLFWLAIGLCTMRLWSGFPLYFLDTIRSGITHLFASNFFLPDWVLFYLPFRPQAAVPFMLQNEIVGSLFRIVPLICLVALFASGRMERVVAALRLLFGTRRRFLITAAVSLGIYYGGGVLATFSALGRVPPIQWATAQALINVLLVCLATWLMPERQATSRAQQRA